MKNIILLIIGLVLVYLCGSITGVLWHTDMLGNISITVPLLIAYLVSNLMVLFSIRSLSKSA